MASVNLKDLAEVQTVGTNQNLLLFGETNNVASRIDYDKLAEAILNKTRDEIGGVSPISAIATLQGTAYTPLFAQTYSTREEVLAALDAYADNIGNGNKFVGYFNTPTSSLLGLSNTSHYFDFFVNSAAYRLLICRPLNGGGTFVLTKTNSSWRNTWIDNPVSWPTDTYVKITTSLETYVANHLQGFYYLWSTTDDYNTVGAPSQNAYHYFVTKTNSSAAIILAVRMTNGSTATMYLKQMYSGTWGSWVTLAV